MTIIADAKCEDCGRVIELLGCYRCSACMNKRQPRTLFRPLDDLPMERIEPEPDNPAESELDHVRH